MSNAKETAAQLNAKQRMQRHRDLVESLKQDHGRIYSNTTKTATIATANVAVKAISTTLAGGVASNFTEGTNGRLTYTGDATKKFKIDFGALCGSATASAVPKLSVRKNSSVVLTATEKLGRDMGEDAEVNGTAFVELAEDDFLELFIENTENDANFSIKSMQLSAYSGGLS